MRGNATAAAGTGAERRPGAVDEALPLLIHLFGPFEARLHGQPLPRLHSRKVQWLLALLVLRHGRDVERSWLAGTLWPDSSEEAAYANLRNSLKDLRRALGPEAGRLRSPTTRSLSLALEGAHVDVVAFDMAIAQGDAAALEQAVALYRGPLLEGCAEEWAFQERQIREQAFLAALETLATHALERGDPAAAEDCLRRVVALEPLRETAQRTLMQALATGGNYAAATQLYRELRLRLHRELNAAPDPETQVLYEQLRAEARGKVAGATERPPLPVGTVPPSPTPSPHPEGTVTFLFTDIEGSSQLWERHPEAMRAALEQHALLLRQAIQAHGGIVFKTVGDAFYAAFATAPATLAAALAAQQALLGEDWSEIGPLRVRMALHTGIAEAREGDYFGATLNRVARLLDAAHGGQVLLSLPTEQLLRDTLPEGAGLRPLGEHRLKDLVRPEQVFQLLHPDLPAAFPPLRSLEAFAHNLPVQLTSFVGREREMAEIERLLASTHLLTLTGAGGCGKTRLALQIAADLVAEYGDGVWLVELAALTDPALLPQTVASALGVREEPSRPLAATLADHLRARALLLVLDNCEHLLTACAGLAETLLRSCPRLRILATSREGLRIAGETSYRVPPLSLPPSQLSTLLQSEAACLFVERALAAMPSFVLTDRNAAAVAQLCHRLDGIPLAIELAAARVKALPVEKLAERLDDRFRLLTGGSRTALPRQQTLRALIDWSYDLLTDPEQALLRRLSVFAGGWSLEAAEAVGAGQGAEEWEVLDLLTALVDKSLVQYEERGQEPRYRLLETVRQYARDRLLEAGEGPAVWGRHLSFFLRLVQEAAPKLSGGEQGLWLDRLETDHDNLRAAIEWSLAAEEGWKEGLPLTLGLGRYWDLRNRFTEALQYLKAFAAQSADLPIEARARVLHQAGFMAMKQADYPAARRYFEESSTLRRQQGGLHDPPGLLHDRGALALHEGDYSQAAALLHQALRIYREFEEADRHFDRSLLMWRLNTLGLVAYYERDFHTARSFYEQSLNLAREIDDKAGIGDAMLGLGRIAMMECAYSSARALLDESLSILRGVKDKHSSVWALISLARICSHEGDYATAQAYLVEGLVLCRETGRYWESIDTLVSAGNLAQRQGNSVRAVRLFGTAEALREAIGEAMPPVDRAGYDGSIAAARAALGGEAFAAAWAEGRAMPLEEAIRVALEEEAGG